MTEVIGIGKAAVSVLGGVYAGVMLFIFLVINPAITKKHVSSSILTGLVLQGAALLAMTLIPRGGMFYAILAVGLYAVGYGIFIPFLSALVADVAEGREMARIYSLSNTIISIVSAMIGGVSGLLYAIEPRLIFIITVVLLALCIGTMLIFIAHEKRYPNGSNNNVGVENIGA
jgi:MFS family permease